MKIAQEVWEKIFSDIGETPPEVGGILGMSKDVVDSLFIDCGVPMNKLCSYTPDVTLLNHMIDIWQQKEIRFVGIFHSHYFGVKSLSEGDKKYIKLIMNSMPSDINSLYFPVAVMPDKELVVYKAYRCERGLELIKEQVEIL